MNIGEKISAIRKHLKLSQAAFAKPLGIGAPYVSEIENGNKEPSETLVSLIRSHYVISDGWWDTGEGEIFAKPQRGDIAKAENKRNRPEGAFDIPPPGEDQIPIVSWGKAGPDGYFVECHAVGDAFAWIKRPYDLKDKNAYALIVSGDSMYPKYEPGDMVVVSPAAGVQPGDCAVIRIIDHDGPAMIKKVRQRNGNFVLESINPAYDPIECLKEDVVYMHKIVWVKQRG